MGYEQHFLDSLTNVGVSTKLVNYKRKGSPEGFVAKSGSVDMSNGEGEVQMHGKIAYQQGSMELTTSLLQMDTTGPETVVTALVSMNNVVVGRQVVFRILSGFPFRFEPSDGTVDTGAVHFKMDPTFWTELTTFFQMPTLTPGPTSGELRLVVTLDGTPDADADAVTAK